MSTHSSHSSHSSHSNTIANSGYTLQSHSVSIGSTSIKSVPSKLEGSLTALNNAASEARASLSSPNSTQTVGNKPTNAEVQKILKNSGGTQRAKYQNGTISFNAESGTGHCNSSSSNDENNPPASFSAHINTTKGANIAVDTSPLRDIAQAQTSYPNGSYTVSAGSKMTTADAREILAIINKGKVSKSTVPSFGTWSITGTSHYQHSNCSKEYKCDISEYTGDPLEVINKAQIVNFKYKDDDDHINHIGFIAENTPEELATILHDRMDFTNCIGVLLKAVQKLDERIKELEVEIDSIRS